MSLKIDSEFKNLIPSLTPEEYAQLEENLIKDGCRDALILWDGILVDGHNRYEICTRNKIQFKTIEKSFDSREDVVEWIIRNQFGRRNITTAQRCDLVLKLEDVIKARARGNKQEAMSEARANNPKNTNEQFNPKSDATVNKVNTNDELAKLAGVGHNTIHQFRVVKKEGTPELQQQVLKSEISINKAYKSIRPKEDKPVTSKPDELETNEKEDRKCNQCGRTKSANEFYEGKGNCIKCHAYLKTGSKVTGIKIDGDQIFREITEIGTINKISYSYIVTEIEQIINAFSGEISNYAYKKQAIESLNFEEKEFLVSHLEKAESWIKQIKKLLEV